MNYFLDVANDFLSQPQTQMQYGDNTTGPLYKPTVKIIVQIYVKCFEN